MGCRSICISDGRCFGARCRFSHSNGLRVYWAIAFFMAIDLVLMPACRPVVELSGGWLVGEAIAVCVVLLPAQLLARWTLDDEHLGWRATLQMAMSASILLSWIPEIIFAMRPATGWARLENEPPWLKSIGTAMCISSGCAGNFGGSGICATGQRNAHSIRSAKETGGKRDVSVRRESDAAILLCGDDGVGRFAAKSVGSSGGSYVVSVWAWARKLG